MGKPKYDPPTPTFPYKISKRLNMMSEPKDYYTDSVYMPPVSEMGIRISALRGKASDRINEASYPLLRMYKHRFSQERMEKIDKMIDATNATIYTKLANAGIDLKKGDKELVKDMKKKRGWSDSDWKKHMEYINQIAAPKKAPEPEPIPRGEIMPLEAMLPRLRELAQVPESKMYRTLSEEDWYRDPLKVPDSALTYNITERTKQLAAPRIIHGVS